MSDEDSVASIEPNQEAHHRKQAAQRAKEWIGTLNNPYEDDEDEVDAEHARSILKAQCLAAIAAGGLHYFASGYELAPSTGTPHIHFAAKFRDQLRRGQIYAMLPALAGSYLAPRSQRATWAHSVDYFKYVNPGAPAAELLINDTFWEVGTFPGVEAARAAGRAAGGATFKARSELAMSLAKRGKLWEIDADMLLRYWGPIRSVAGGFRPKDRDGIDDVWLWGPPGSGKSLYVRKWCEGHNLTLYVKQQGTKWFDNYEGQDVILIDDCDHDMNRMRGLVVALSDHYAAAVEVKGAMLYIRPRFVAYTSNFSIDQIWPLEEDRTAIKRRLHQAQMTSERKPRCLVKVCAGGRIPSPLEVTVSRWEIPGLGQAHDDENEEELEA